MLHLISKSLSVFTVPLVLMDSKLKTPGLENWLSVKGLLCYSPQAHRHCLMFCRCSISHSLQRLLLKIQNSTWYHPDHVGCSISGIQWYRMEGNFKDGKGKPQLVFRAVQLPKWAEGRVQASLIKTKPGDCGLLSTFQKPFKQELKLLLLRQEQGNSLLLRFTLLRNEPGVSMWWPNLHRKQGKALRLVGGFTVTMVASF